MRGEVKTRIFDETSVADDSFTPRQRHLPALVARGAQHAGRIVDPVVADGTHPIGARSRGGRGALGITTLGQGLGLQQRVEWHCSGRIPDTVGGILRQVVIGVGRGQHRSGREVHHVAAIRVYGDAGRHRDRLRRHGGVQDGGGRRRRRQVEFPHRSVQVTGVNDIDVAVVVVVNRCRRRQPVRTGGAAGAGGGRRGSLDGMDQRTGVGIDHIQIGLVVAAVVVPIAHDHHVGSAEFAKTRVGIGKSQIGVGRVGHVVDGGGRDLPQDVVGHRRFGGGRQPRAAGNVKRVQTLAAGAQRPHQHPLGRAADADVGHIGRPVDEIVGYERGVRQRLHFRDQHRRNIGPAFVTGLGVKSMQHAVVGADKNRRIGAVLQVERPRMDDCAQRRLAPLAKSGALTGA